MVLAICRFFYTSAVMVIFIRDEFSFFCWLGKNPKKTRFFWEFFELCRAPPIPPPNLIYSNHTYFPLTPIPNIPLSPRFKYYESNNYLFRNMEEKTENIQGKNKLFFSKKQGLCSPGAKNRDLLGN